MSTTLELRTAGSGVRILETEVSQPRDHARVWVDYFAFAVETDNIMYNYVKLGFLLSRTSLVFNHSPSALFSLSSLTFL